MASSVREAARVGARVVPLTDGFTAELRRFLEAAERELQLQIPTSLDTAQAREDLRRLQAELDSSAVEVSAGMNTADARAELDRLKASVDGTSGTVKVGVDRARADSDVSAVRSGLSTLAGIARSIVIGTGFAAAAAGLATAVVQGVALAAALASAAGAAALIPAAVAALAVVTATAVVGLSGIGDALKAQGKAADATAGAAANPNAAIDSARQIAAAQRALQAAYRNVADERVQDARRIADAEQAIRDAQQSGHDTMAGDLEAVHNAEESLTRAQRDQLRAQTDLTDARAAAAQQIADLKVQLAGASVDQEKAALDLAQAKKHLADVNANDFSTDLERQAAQVAVDEASQKVAETAQNYADLKAKSDKANAAGVDGAANVVAAQDRLTDAVQATRDAQQALADARRRESEDSVSSARAVARAQRDLADAQHQQARDRLDEANTLLDAQDRLAQASESAAKAAGVGSAADNAAAVAMGKLSPKARELVTDLLALRPAWQSVQWGVQDTLLDQLGTRVTTLAGRALPVLRAGMIAVAGSLNLAARETIDFAGRSSTLSVVSRVFGDVHRTLDALLPALDPVYRAMLLVLGVGAGFGPGLAAGFTGFLTTIAAGLARAAQDGSLARFIGNALTVVKQLGQIALNVGSVLFSVFNAGQDSGGRLLTSIVAITGRVAELARSAQGQSALAAMFSTAESAVRAVVNVLRAAGPAVAGFFTGLQGNGRVGDDLESIRSSATTLGPAIAAAFKHDATQSFTDTLSVASTVMHFAATHAGELAKVLPLLIGAYTAFKAAQAASNLVGAAELPIHAAQVVTNVMLTNAMRAHTVQLAINNGLEADAVVVRGRSLVATVAQTAASWAANAAGKAWAATQAALNAVMDANVIALVVLAVLALVAGVILAYQHSEKFRQVVQAAFKAVGAAATALWRDAIQPAVNAIAGGFTRLMNGIRSIVDWARAHWPELLAILTGPIGLAVLAITRNWHTIMDGITAVRNWIGDRVDDIGGAFGRVPGMISGLAGRARSAGLGLMHAVVDGISAALGQVDGAVSNIAGEIWNGLRRILNQKFIDPIRDFRVNLTVLGHGVHLAPFSSIPELAQGATVLPTQGGTLAVLAEAGRPESVVDTGLLNRQLDLTNRIAEKVLAGGGASRSVTFDQKFYVQDQDPSLTAAVVVREIGKAVI